MQKQYNIRWSKDDTNALAKEVRRFNAKRTRLIKQNPELVEFLPDKLSTKDIKANTTTRKDFNNTLNSINRFMRKGAEAPIISETGIKTTNYELKETALKVRRINQRRAYERKQADVSTEKGTMGTIRSNNLNPKPFDINKIKAGDWDKYVESVEKQSKASYTMERNQAYKDNYINALTNVFGEKAKEIIDLLKNVDGGQLVQMFYDEPILQIDFIYDPLEAEVRREAITEHLKEAL